MLDHYLLMSNLLFFCCAAHINSVRNDDLPVDAGHNPVAVPKYVVPP